MDSKIKNSNASDSSLLFSFMKGSWGYFVLSILCSFISSGADMVIPQIMRCAIDNVIGGSDEMTSIARTVTGWFGGTQRLRQDLWIVSLAVMAVAAVKAVSQYTFRVSNTKGSETLAKTMRDTLFSHIERLPFEWHMKNHTGDIIQRCTSDIDTLRRFISEQMTSVVRILIMLILSMTFMFSMNPRLTLIALIPTPVIFIYSLVYQSKMRTRFRVCDESEGVLSAMAQENLTGVRVVRAFGRERYERDRFEAHNEEYTGLWRVMAKLMSRFWCVSDTLCGIQVLVVIAVGAWLAVSGRMLAGEYVAFISYNSMMAWPVRQLGRVLSEMSRAGVSVERISEIQRAEEEKNDPEAQRPKLDRDIRFEHVNFSYDGQNDVLTDIDFTMKAGSTLGIMGGTGSGKSTIVLLLDKLYEIQKGRGRITIGGVDIRDIDTKHLRENIGMVLQEPFLFSASIAENIAITAPDIDMERVREASAAACLDEAVEGFAKGYETYVGERGVTLSGGQKQRAAIARTLMKDTPIMIFDDSLSAVDMETDAKIRASLEKRFGTASIILISHRINTLSKADKIIVLDHGRISEEGTHDQLKTAGGIYQRIYEIQSGGKEAADEQ